MASEYRQALEALYGNNAELQAQANMWLNEFQGQHVAWEASLSCLETSERTEVAFFSANVLLKKAKSADWSRLGPEMKEQLRVAVGSKMDAWVVAGGSALVIQRLTMVMAAMAAVSGPDAAEEFVGRAFSMVAAARDSPEGPVLQYGLYLLLHLAEESDSLDTRRKNALAQRLTAHTPQLLHITHQILASLANATTATVACQCLLAWLKVSPNSDGTLCLSPGEFAAAAGPLFSRLLEVLALPMTDASRFEATARSATDLLVELLGPGKDGASPADDRAALQAALAGLVALREAVRSIADGSEQVCVSIARVVASISDRDTDLLVNPHSEHALPLAELMLSCLMRSEQKVAEAAAEYFLMVNTVPLAERHVQLQGPLYSSALPYFMHHAMYPSGFTIWDESDVDEDSFHRFRDVLLLDVLETAFNMMKGEYLAVMTSAAVAATTWQQYEVVLYCVRAVSLRVKARILGRDGSGHAAFGHSHGSPQNAVDPETARLAAEAHSQLMTIFTDLCSGDASKKASGFLPNGWVCRSACHLIGEYAAWFGKAEQAPLEGALHLLLHALCVPVCWTHAAHAFRNICVRCKTQLSAGTALTGLMDLAARAVAPSPPQGAPATSVPMELDDRLAVIEGLARVVAGLPPAAAAAGGLHLIRPLVERAQSLAHAGTTQEQLRMLSIELKLIAATVRFLDFPHNHGNTAEEHPALKTLEGAWPILSAVAQAPICQRDPLVVEALCDVYQRSILAAKLVARPLLSTLIVSVLTIFRESLHPSCCDVLGTSVEVFGEVKSFPETAALQQQALATISATTAEYVVQMQQQGNVDSCADLVRGVYCMADRFVVFAREVLLNSPACTQLMALASVALSMKEREPVAEVLSFLTHLMALPDKVTVEEHPELAQQLAGLKDSVSAEGEHIMRALITSLCNSCPRSSIRALSGCVYGLFTSATFGSAAGNWLIAAMQASAAVTGIKADLLTPEDQHRFCTLALMRPILNRGRFDALMNDVAGIARGEQTSDVLLSYEIAGAKP